jgi:hypothetical protein
MTAGTGTAGQEPAAAWRFARSNGVRTFFRMVWWSQHWPSLWADLLQLRSLDATRCARTHTELSHSVVSCHLTTETLEKTVIPLEPEI